MKIKHVAATILLTVLTLVTCNFLKNKEKTQSVSFVNPPLPSANVPNASYLVDAEKGDTISHSTSSQLVFPPHSFVDENGQPVQGAVEVHYREFSNPIDFFLSGIPMQYDSAGTTYNFESAGMCDITAFQKGKAVFVNPAARPVINMVSNDASDNHCLYFLDTANKKWVNVGKSKIVAINAPETTEETNSSAIVLPIKPVKPEKINGDMPVIRVRVDTASFAELRAYDKLQFQLDKNENRFDPKDASEEWSEFKLKKRNAKGLYEISFSNQKRMVAYLAKPVLDDDDYERGLKQFATAMQKYERDIKKVKLEQASRMKEKFSIDSKNKVIDKENEMMVKRNEMVIAHNKKITSENIKNMSSTLRSFQINQFGIWNCDRPLPNYFKGQFQLVANFFDENQNDLSLNNTNVFYRSINGLIPTKDNTINIAQYDDNMIIGMKEDAFYYASYEDIKSLKLSPAVKECKFRMKKVESKNNNYKYISSLFQN